ncbi:hypothetical protein O6H91_03G095100 [Diphasiastrum complanatum]|uniref:Uncharacterized protein n=1 Tax=Diphasiastrum complanatum TaxID=34168 RepID=A0ACC2E9B6_DIPCM|nr:hypothetical protein O6H91_03G095100 [Diphasiastrum complanatum]
MEGVRAVLRSCVARVGGLTAIVVLLLCAVLTLITHATSRKKKACPPVKEGMVEICESLDWAPARRRVFAAFQSFRTTFPHTLFHENNPRVKTKEMYQINTRGVELFTKSWFPETDPAKAIVCLCHGYGDTITFYLDGFARKLATAQYVVLGMDYEGFGLSSGLHGYIHNFDTIVDDVIEHYSTVTEQPELMGLPRFLFGQSMGGAVALKVLLKQQNAWNGAILVAPMCKIADDMYPPWLLVQILKVLVPMFPTWKLVPNRDVAGYGFRDIKKRKQTAYNVIGYGDRPRLKTALELLRATDDIEANLHRVSLPLLILHGAADRITDPSVSKALYQLASSSEKNLHLYEDAWHCILEGESDEIIHKVLGDIIVWLDSHCDTQVCNK